MIGAGGSPGRLISAAPGVSRGFEGGGEVAGGSAGVTGVALGAVVGDGKTVSLPLGGLAGVAGGAGEVAPAAAGGVAGEVATAAGEVAAGAVAAEEVAAGVLVPLLLADVGVAEIGAAAVAEPAAGFVPEGEVAMVALPGGAADELGGAAVTALGGVLVVVPPLAVLSAAPPTETPAIITAVSPIKTRRPCAMTVLRPARPM